MARKKRPTGDEATNARKRYYRAAERHLKNAQKLTGASAARERKLAEIQFENALNTYDPETTQRASKPMRRLANEFGIDIEQRRRELSRMPEKLRDYRIEQAKETRKELISDEQSKRARVKNLRDVEKRREYEAETLFGQQNIAHRILGGTVDVWRDAARNPVTGKIDKEKILPALYREYKVSTLGALLNKIENIVGDIIYAAKSDEAYDVMKLTLQFANAVKRNM